MTPAMASRPNPGELEPEEAVRRGMERLREVEGSRPGETDVSGVRQPLESSTPPAHSPTYDRESLKNLRPAVPQPRGGGSSGPGDAKSPVVVQTAEGPLELSQGFVSLWQGLAGPHSPPDSRWGSRLRELSGG